MQQLLHICSEHFDSKEKEEDKDKKDKKEKEKKESSADNNQEKKDASPASSCWEGRRSKERCMCRKAGRSGTGED